MDIQSKMAQPIKKHLSWKPGDLSSKLREPLPKVGSYLHTCAMARTHTMVLSLLVLLKRIRSVIICPKLDMVAHVYNPSTWETREEWRINASLGCTQWLSQNQNNNNNKEYQEYIANSTNSDTSWKLKSFTYILHLNKVAKDTSSCFP